MLNQVPAGTIDSAYGDSTSIDAAGTIFLNLQPTSSALMIPKESLAEDELAEG